jgi:hypothetical protein
MDSDLSSKIVAKYCCKICHYYTSRNTDYVKHLSTDKHKKRENDSGMVENGSNLSSKVVQYECKCGKIYKYDSGYYRHKKKCDINNVNLTDVGNNVIECEKAVQQKLEINDLIKYLMNENSELKHTMMEQQNTMMEQQNMMMKVIENGTTNNSNNTTNSHNKAFNLNFFLNETCKNAMNITDFVESIQLQLSDLEKVGEIGYVEGISNIIVKNLNALDVTQRPVHCTDKKRETIYIKDEDKWEKDEEKNKIRKVIKKVATKNARLIQKFKDKHPDYNEYHSKYSTQYHKLIIESMGGSGDNDVEKEDKIIRNIAKNIVVDK